MEIIQLVLDSELLQATNGAARRARLNRSALIRQALREHLKRAAAREVEALDRRGYQEHPETEGEAEAEAWEQVASWPAR